MSQPQDIDPRSATPTLAAGAVGHDYALESGAGVDRTLSPAAKGSRENSPKKSSKYNTVTQPAQSHCAGTCSLGGIISVATRNSKGTQAL